jgi:hypothetical protein
MPQYTPEEERNIHTIRDMYYPEFLDGGNIDLADRMIHADYYNDSHPDWPRGPEGIKRVHRMLHTALTELRMDIHNIMASDNVVIIWATQSGVWKGTEHLFGVMESEGTVYRQHQAHRFEFDRDGLITEHRVQRDDKETRVDQYGKVN